MSGIAQGVSQKFNDVRTFFSNGLNNVKNLVTNAISWFRDSGKKIVTTFAEGISSAFSSAVNAVKNGLQKIRNMLPFSDAKEGPLSTLTLSGQRTMTTYAEGLTLAQNAPAEAMEKGLSQAKATLEREPTKKVNLNGGSDQSSSSGETESSGSGSKKGVNIQTACGRCAKIVRKVQKGVSSWGNQQWMRLQGLDCVINLHTQRVTLAAI